jgi:PTH1 family peptidyl-tRNA hydrolase
MRAVDHHEVTRGESFNDRRTNDGPRRFCNHEGTGGCLGQIVVEKGGDDKAQLGVASIATSLRSKNFIRIRIGIKNNSFKGKDKEKFLKEDFSPAENLRLIEIINDAEAAIRSISIGDIDEVVEKYRL